MNTVVILLETGWSVKDIAQKTGFAESTVYKYAKEAGVNMKTRKGAVRSRCEEFDSDIQKMLSDGKSYKEIGLELGINRETVKWYARKHGYRSTASLWGTVKNPNLTLIAPPENNHSRCRVKCKTCGFEFVRRWDSLISKECECPNCRTEHNKIKQEALRKEKDKRKKELALAKEKEKQERRELLERKKAEAEEIKRKAKLHPCPVCGKTTSRPKYCCDQCANRMYNKTRETKRRLKIQEAMVDRDITVQSLYKRDEGVCYLCGGKTLLNDYIVRDGTIICGDWYPSIDHVIPLAAGGEHSWKNVKLAHRICNSLKSDDIVIPK